MMTKLPNQEDEQEGKGGRHQQQPRAALAPVPNTANAVRDTMTAVPPSPGHRIPQRMPGAAVSVSKAQVTHVLSHIRHGSTHAGKLWGTTRPAAATETTAVPMPPWHGPAATSGHIPAAALNLQSPQEANSVVCADRNVASFQ